MIGWQLDDLQVEGGELDGSKNKGISKTYRGSKHNISFQRQVYGRAGVVWQTVHGEEQDSNMP